MDSGPDADRSGRRGATLLDLAALVGGMAIASSLLRTGLVESEGEGPLARALAVAALAVLVLTSAGPWVFLERRLGPRTPGQSAHGDRLWAILGLPWSLATLVRVVEGAIGGGGVASASVLIAGVSLASLAAAGEAWSRSWAAFDDEGRTWTERVGLALAVAFPIQWGLALTVLALDG